MTAPEVWSGEYALRPFLVPIDSIRPHPRNPRQGDVGAMSLSLERFGQYRPAVVRAGDGPEAGEIVAGSHMWKAAKALGWTHLAVLPRVMGEQEAVALMLADNRVADRGSYDQAALADLLQDLQAADDGRLDPALGYDEEDLADLLSVLDRSGPPPPLPDAPGGGSTPAAPAPAEPQPREVRFRLGPEDAAALEEDLSHLSDAWETDAAGAMLRAVREAAAADRGET